MWKFILFSCMVFLRGVSYAQTTSNTNGNYDIYALKFGERNNYVKMETVAVGDNSGDSTRVFYMYWLLRGKNNNRIILVDAGFTEDAEVDSTQITFISPDKLLSAVNLKPDEITDIIITHPHWDHIGGISLYPNAMLWMQEEDYIEFVKQRKNYEAVGFNEKDIQKVLDRKEKGTLTLLKDLRDQIILPNVTVFTSLSKHTAGSQYIMVYNGTQNVIIASDNCKYYRNMSGMLSSPATTDQTAYVRSLRTMKRIIPDTDLIIPGHDPLVFTKFKSVGKDVVQIKK